MICKLTCPECKQTQDKVLDHLQPKIVWCDPYLNGCGKSFVVFVVRAEAPSAFKYSKIRWED